MADEKTIDTMSTEELNAALKSDLDQLDGKAQAEPEDKVNAQPEPKPAEALKSDAKALEIKPDDAGDGDEGKGDDDAEGNPYRKRIDRLVRKRDDLNKSVVEKEARIAQLEAENAKLKGDDKHDDDIGDDNDQKKPDLSKTIHQVLDEREQTKTSAAERQRVQDEEFSALEKIVPNAKERKVEILEMSKKFPDLTFEAIDRILAPADHVDPIEANRANARRMDVSARSRADLEKDKDMTKATAKEQEKYLREEIAAGRLIV